MHQPLLVLHANLTVKAANRAFYSFFQVDPEETEGRLIYDLGNGQWDIRSLRELLEDVLPEKTTVEDFRVEHEFEQIGRRVVMLNAEQIPAVRPDVILVSINDITEREDMRRKLEEQRVRVEGQLLDASHDALLILDRTMCVRRANRTFYQTFHLEPEDIEGCHLSEVNGGAWDRPHLGELIEGALRDGHAFDGVEISREFDRIGHRIMGLNGRRIDHEPRVLLAIEDLTERRQEERRRADQASRRGFLLDLSDMLRAETDTGRLIETACQALGQRLGVNQVSLFNIDADQTTATLVQGWNDGRISENAGPHKLSDFGEAFIADLQRGNTVAIGDVRDDARTATEGSLAQFDSVSISGFADIPLIRDGRLTAVLALHCTAPRQWSDEATTLAQEVAERLWEAVGRSRAEAKIERLALYDALTDLPNRMLMPDRFNVALARTERSGGQMGIIALDIDHFKQVNDTLGHQAGDELLRHVAERVSGVLRRDDTFARLSGDEFVAILPEIGGVPQMEVMGQRIAATIRAPMRLAGRQVTSTVSMGIAMFPSDGRDLETLTSRADVALYRAKEKCRGSFRFFKPEMEARARSQQHTEMELRRALDQDELRLVYQPQLDLADGHIAMVEALIRWQHPGNGTIMPGDFIPVAELTGLIHPLGEWVLTEACRQIRAWRDEGLQLRVGVNMSAAEVRRDGILAKLDRAFADNALGGGDIELEITESVLLHPSQSPIAELLNGIRKRGIRIALDDFGTGYSALSYLRDLPVGTLKIDRSFVSGMDDPAGRTLIEAMIGLGQKLGKRVVVEGVETKSQLEMLRATNCDAVQGYLISRALAPNQVQAAVASAAGRASK